MPYYDYALDMILDADSPNNEILTEEQHELVESAAEMLYGLIHVRYIVTTRGMSTMFEKYKQCEFGRCPRVLCNDQPTLPVGLADTPRQNTVKIYCPRCGDIYCPRYKYQVGSWTCTHAQRAAMAAQPWQSCGEHRCTFMPLPVLLTGLHYASSCGRHAPHPGTDPRESCTDLLVWLRAMWTGPTLAPPSPTCC